jgi:ATP-binding cassette, subfamily B, bacterial MsbA
LNLYQFLIKHSAKYKKKLAIALLCLSFVSLSNLIYPLLFKLMVDSLSGVSDFFAGFGVTAITVLFLCVITVSAILGYFTNILMQETGSRLRNDIRGKYFSKILFMPFASFKDEQLGGLSSRATEDIGKLQPVFTNLLVPVYQNTLFITGCLILMFMLNAPATFIVLFIILTGLPVMFYFSKKIRKLSGEAQKSHASANAVMEESLFGIREVKAFVLEKLRGQEYKKRAGEALDLEIRSAAYQAKSTQTVFMIVSLMLVVIFYLGTSGYGMWTAGNAAAFYFYAYSLTMAFLSLGRAYTSYNSIAGATSRIVEVLEELPAIEEESVLIRSRDEVIKGKVEFKNVFFGYNAEKIVLKDTSFTADAGSWLLITGPSGAGKSTIANLLLGFYNTTSGEILIDEKNIKEVDIDILRKSTGFVPQEAILFHGTFRENILLGREITEERLNHILEVSMSGDFINGLPEGLYTNIAERGITLSAGQRSRLAIARALVNDPAILILDEANSMLEEGLEKELWRKLYEERKNKTTIIFSHHTKNIPEVYKHFTLG